MFVKAFKHIGIFLVAALLVASCGYSKVKDISVTSVGVAYIVPTSSRSVDAKLLLTIDNPAPGFAVQEVSGVIRYQEKVIAHFVTTGPMELQGKTEALYNLPCTVSLDEGSSILEVLVIASKRSLQGLKADVSIQAAIGKNGVLRAPFTFKDLDISQFKN